MTERDCGAPHKYGYTLPARPGQNCAPRCGSVISSGMNSFDGHCIGIPFGAFGVTRDTSAGRSLDYIRTGDTMLRHEVRASLDLVR